MLFISKKTKKFSEKVTPAEGTSPDHLFDSFSAEISFCRLIHELRQATDFQIPTLKLHRFECLADKVLHADGRFFS